MKEFIANGTLMLQGVTFYVKAKDLKAARLKFAAGTYDSYDDDAAEAVDIMIALASVEENA